MFKTYTPLTGFYFTLFCTLLSLSGDIHSSQDTIERRVSYEIILSDPAHHLAKVTASFPQLQQTSLDVSIPAWRTGRYKIADLANGIDQLQAKDQYGHQLQVKKMDKSTWRIQLNPGSKTIINYELYANQLGIRTRHIDDTHAFLDASATFIYSEQLRQLPIQIQLQVPDNWQSRSGLTTGANQHQFIADNYDILVDSPIETGLHEFYTFNVDNKQYELLIWGKGNHNGEQIVKDLEKLVAQGKKLWGGYPYQRYLFMVHATSGASGATEHRNSTVIQKPRFSFLQRDDYLGFISTASHEYVHTWNVKAYRPKGIHPYDYSKENYSRLFWLAEGSTNYYEDILLLRAGVITHKEYLKGLAKAIKTYKNKPGHLSKSVADASFDTWIAKGKDYLNNNSVDIYNEGLLASMLIDFKVRQLTKNKKGYEDVHRLLYQRFPLNNRGYTESDVKALLQEISGQDFSKHWEQIIDSPLNIDFTSLLKSVGLEIHYSKEEKGNTGWSGLTVKDNNGLVEITLAQKNSPAWKAGLTAGDKIIAINQLHVTNKKLFKKRMEELNNNATATIHFFRRDELQQTTINLSTKPKGKLALKHKKKPSKKQKAAYKAWLGVKWPDKKKS